MTYLYAGQLTPRRLTPNDAKRSRFEAECQLLANHEPPREAKTLPGWLIAKLAQEAEIKRQKAAEVQQAADSFKAKAHDLKKAANKLLRKAGFPSLTRGKAGR